MRVALISDVHFGEHQNNDQFLAMQIAWFREELLPALRERGIRVLFVLGDLFHNKETTNNLVKSRVYDMLRDDFKDFKVIVSVGNHDLYYRDRHDVTALHALRDLPNVKIVDKVTRVALGTSVLAVVPWIIDKEREMAAIASLSPDVVLGHFAFAGFAFNRLYPSRHGEDADSFRMALQSVRKVFSGHYHTQSRRELGTCSFQYLGAPFQYTRIDEGETKGWWVLDTDTLEEEFVPSKKIIRFVRVRYPYTGNDDQLTELVSSNVVEVEVTTTDFSTKPFAKFMTYVETLRPYRCEAKLLGSEVGAPSRLIEEQREEGEEPRTILSFIEEFVRTQVEGDAEYKLTLMGELNNLYGEASSVELK